MLLPTPMLFSPSHRNDLKEIMAQIETGLHSLHAQSREGIGVTHPDAVPCQDAPRKPIPQTFAKVDKVEENSPASEAGLLAGDELSAFGSVNTENFSSMKLLSEVRKLICLLLSKYQWRNPHL